MLSIEQIKTHIINEVEGNFSSLILYGSYARGDFNTLSDVDVLQIVSSPRESYKKGKINYSVYTLNHLVSMAREGNLFVLHLIQDGIYLIGNENDFTTIIQSFKRKENYNSFREDIKHASSLLDFDEDFYDIHFVNANSLLAYLLRSYVYSLIYDKGLIKFSIKESSKIIGDPRIVGVSKLKDMAYPDYKYFLYYKKVLEEYTGTKIYNPFRSIEALVFNSTISDKKLTSNLGMRLLKTSEGSIAYG